jgi:WD40 repeat protein
MPPTNFSLEATHAPTETPRAEVYIGDVPTRQKTRLGEVPAYLTLNEAVWSEDETRVALHLSGATSETYIADLQADVITPLRQMSNIQVIESAAPLAISSDGQTLAAWSDYTLWLVSLANGHAIKIDDPVLNAEFSRNGETLYYAWGDQTQNELRSYDMTSSITSTIVGPSREVHFDRFTVSPDGDRIAVWDWGRRLRLIVLKE